MYADLKSVSKNGDSVVEKLSNKVNYPDDEVSDTGEGNEKAYDEGNDVLLFNESDDSVDTAYNHSENKLDQELEELGEGFVCFGNGRGLICHEIISF